MSTPGQLQKMNIMVAIDGSEHSRAAVNLICDLPLPAKSSLTAVTVLIPRNASDHANLEAILNYAKELLTESYNQVFTELLVGYPSEELTRYAEDNRPDLIVLGAKGLRASLGILLGGVAQQVIEYAPCPILIVRAPYEGLRRVLLVTDGSTQGQRAIEYFGNLPLPESTEVYLLHVLPPLPSSTGLAYAWPMEAELFTPISSPETEESLAHQAAQEERDGQLLLERTQNVLQSFRIQATPVIKRGDAATEILEFTKSHQVDLIVAGSRGLGRVQSWLLGSLSRKLVHYAPCSVLIVK